MYNIDDNLVPAVLNGPRVQPRFQVAVREGSFKLVWGQAAMLHRSSLYLYLLPAPELSSVSRCCVSRVPAVRIITVYRAAATRNPSHHSGYLDTYCANIRSFSPVFRKLVWSLDRCITN